MTRKNETISEDIQNLEDLSMMLGQRAYKDRAFKHAIGTLPNDLAYIAKSLASDPDFRRLNRAFHIVHVPSLIAVVTMFNEFDDMVSISSDETKHLLASLTQASSLARTARERIEKARINQASIEISVLAKSAGAPLPAKQQQQQQPSLFNRTMQQVSSASETIWNSAKSGASVVPDATNDVVGGALSRVAALPVLADNMRKTVAGKLADQVTQRIGLRPRASGRALENGVGAGVGMGVVASILFPPLLPISAGGAVYVAMRTWRKEVEKAQGLNEVAQKVRLEELAAERSSALRQLSQGASALQLETDEISMTLDVETGQADVVVLAGPNTGSLWSSLSVLEKADTLALLGDSAKMLLDIVKANDLG